MIVVDDKCGLIFFFILSVSLDFYGGECVGDNFYMNFVVVFKGEMGELVWYF